MYEFPTHTSKCMYIVSSFVSAYLHYFTVECKVVVTGNVAQLGDSSDLLKKKVDKALKDCSVQHVLVANAPGIPCRMQEGRDISLEEVYKYNIS